LLAEAARHALAEHRCQVGWLPSGSAVELREGRVNGYCEPLSRRVYAPHPSTVSDLCTLLHEVGHVADARLGASYLEREAAATEWALGWWKRHDLPDTDQAAFALRRGFEAAVRHQAALDNTPVRQIERELAA
jgi:hypothetical protein